MRLGRTARLRRPSLPALLLCALALLGGRAACAASGAEFAVRWNPAEGGPQDAKEVAAALQLRAGKRKDFVVRYFSVEQGVVDAKDGVAIVRERQEKHASESMFKLRSASAFDSPADPLAGWQCPFPAAAGAVSKSEVDVGWTALRETKTTYSRSCQADDTVEQLLPAAFKARPLSCTSQVRRTEAGDFKIERWRMPNGRTTLEVSWDGRNDPADFKRFEEQVVGPLIARGIRPIDQSKTEMGSHC